MTTTEATTPPTASEPFATADADTLAGLSATFRALAVTLASQINSLAADFDALAAARGGSGTPSRLPEPSARRSVGDLIALPTAPTAPPVEPT
uniref:hypothetical protein n=1 Tax=Microbacterium sp. TaxID=51671 RepID=UPI0026091F94